MIEPEAVENFEPLRLLSAVASCDARYMSSEDREAEDIHREVERLR